MSVDFLVDVGGQKVCIINNHLQSYGISEKEREDFHHILQGDVEADTARIETLQLIEKLSKGTTRRAAQVRMVAARIQQRLKEGLPVIACGDLNDTPHLLHTQDPVEGTDRLLHSLGQRSRTVLQPQRNLYTHRPYPLLRLLQALWRQSR